MIFSQASLCRILHTYHFLWGLLHFLLSSTSCTALPENRNRWKLCNFSTSERNFDLNDSRDWRHWYHYNVILTPTLKHLLPFAWWKDESEFRGKVASVVNVTLVVESLTFVPNLSYLRNLGRNLKSLRWLLSRYKFGSFELQQNVEVGHILLGLL